MDDVLTKLKYERSISKQLTTTLNIYLAVLNCLTGLNKLGTDKSEDVNRLSLRTPCPFTRLALLVESARPTSFAGVRAFFFFF